MIQTVNMLISDEDIPDINSGKLVRTGGVLRNSSDGTIYKHLNILDSCTSNLSTPNSTLIDAFAIVGLVATGTAMVGTIAEGISIEKRIAKKTLEVGTEIFCNVAKELITCGCDLADAYIEDAYSNKLLAEAYKENAESNRLLAEAYIENSNCIQTLASIITKYLGEIEEHHLSVETVNLLGEYTYAHQTETLIFLNALGEEGHKKLFETMLDYTEFLQVQNDFDQELRRDVLMQFDDISFLRCTLGIQDHFLSLNAA